MDTSTVQYSNVYKTGPKLRIPLIRILDDISLPKVLTIIDVPLQDLLPRSAITKGLYM